MEVVEMALTDADIQKVWEKGTVVAGYDSNQWRQDECRAWIGRQFYGKS